ncbi:alanyl-tRNA synthetase, putative [Theileria equi strain WA]|uniref:Alanine--tRNA ligase n=1 Tax=Theileria equi strain WA TaxID=1537102 RepID=L1LFY4_THEEQ|nr:alanyl-tRNA synthetase, putative [Theileria equi strain WA]EKX74175.1 alanyl-tRNA synthetase, putative [Theileria equi strain WA]|eukprot:XP_004833627.1 alanyl-tRNA synthetase, putative [Theileria equi strain WA]
MKNSSWVRSEFIKYFEKKGHVHWPSASVLPCNDPTLLFVNAGMNQFKDIIMGKSDESTEFGRLRRVANSQKCIRAGGKHNDLDDVGHDCYHNTFFEMLGNWSFGDYFKKEAIEYAFELLTTVYGLDKDRLYVTYFGGDPKISCPPDDEARKIWMQYLPEERILPFGLKDNFWEMADVGPCGPCSEIHYDHVGNRDAASLVNADDPQVVEIWNLVFMQYNRKSDGTLEPLPRPCVDTGMGLERLCAVLLGSSSNYDADVLSTVMNVIHEKVPGLPAYSGSLNIVDTAYRVVADHVRCLTIAIADGVYPSNDGRGYVLRRILRRAVRYAREHLGVDGPFLHTLVDSLVNTYGDAYKEVVENKDIVKSIIHEEEELFLKTLDKGRERFRRMIKQAQQASPDGSTSGQAIVSAQDAFLLYSSYGFPLDLTVLMAKEYGVGVDTDGFKEELKKHQEKSDRRVNKDDAFANLLESLSADKLDVISKHCNGVLTDDSAKYQWSSEDPKEQIFDAKVLAIWTEGGLQDVQDADVFALVTDVTPFYAEGGGQIYDEGFIDTCQVHKVYKMSGLVFHFCTAGDTPIHAGSTVKMRVDYDRRVKVACNHTCTHLLNFVLRDINKDTKQRGSQLDAEKLKFDFNGSGALSEDVLQEIERKLANFISKELEVVTKSIPYKEALEISGIRANFDEKYPEIVRVVSVGKDDGLSTSIEVCGGTHLGNTKTIQSAYVIGEEGISKGVRRLTLVTNAQSATAASNLKHFETSLDNLVGSLKDIKMGGDTSLAFMNANENMKQLTALRAIVQDEKLVPLVGKRKLLSKFEQVIDEQVFAIKAHQKRLANLAKSLASDYIEEIKTSNFESCEYTEGDPSVVRFFVNELEGDLKSVNMMVQTMSKAFPKYAFVATSVHESAICCRCMSPDQKFNALEAANSIAKELGCFPENMEPAKGSATNAMWTLDKTCA